MPAEVKSSVCVCCRQRHSFVNMLGFCWSCWKETTTPRDEAEAVALAEAESGLPPDVADVQGDPTLGAELMAAAEEFLGGLAESQPATARIDRTPDVIQEGR